MGEGYKGVWGGGKKEGRARELDGRTMGQVQQQCSKSKPERFGSESKWRED
jgi:hypothetical protein